MSGIEKEIEAYLEKNTFKLKGISGLLKYLTKK